MHVSDNRDAIIKAIMFLIGGLNNYFLNWTAVRAESRVCDEYHLSSVYHEQVGSRIKRVKGDPGWSFEPIILLYT
jgi:hypothetical protein